MNAQGPFEAVALLISGRRILPKLADALATAGMGVTAAARDEKDAPTAVSVQGRLAEIARAAFLLRDELHNQHILSRLDCAGAEPMASWGLVSMLADLEARARAAAAAVPKQKGRGKPAVDPDGFDAKDLCALIVFKAWFATHGEPPGVGHETAHQACDEYWQACAQRPLGRSGSGWRRHLTTARTIAAKPRPGRQANGVTLIDELLGTLG